MTVLYALAGGILPALLWLWFWLKEDVNPEPKRIILFTFVAGMATVPAALFFEGLVQGWVPAGFLLFAAWVTIEEVLKLFAAWVIALRLNGRFVDEPIDPFIYMVTAALGFAAAENALFLLTPLGAGEVLSGFLTGSLRFVGATVLHTISSAAIGAALGFAYYRSRNAKRIALLIGLFTAIALHTLFNISILMSDQRSIFIVFAGVWIAAIIALLLIERVKRVKRKRKAQSAART